MMNMVKRFISTLVLVVALVGSVSAQSLDDLSKKVLDLSIEAAKKAEEERKAEEEALKAELEALKAELEALKAIAEALKAIAEAKAEYWEAIDILHCCVFCDPINKDILMKCYCYPIEDFVWYHAFLETDGKIWVNIFYDDNGEIGEILFADVMQEEEPTSYTESVTGIKTPALKVTFTSGDLLFIQDTSDPYKFAISW